MNPIVFSSFGKVVLGYKFGSRKTKEFTDSNYFDFIFLDLDGNITEEAPVAGGSCGFTIDKKTLEIKNLTFCDLGMIAQNEREINNVYNKLTDIKEKSKSLMWLKSTYKLSSPELLKIKKAIDTTKFEKETVLEQIDQLIKTTTNTI